MFGKLTNLLDSFLEMGIPGYDCVVYHKGKCVYRHCNGYSDQANKIAVKGDEIYNIYSCSKVITCTAALQLYEKGLFKLDDKLSEYMPEFEEMYVSTENGVRKAENSITVKDLFCMTAGFSYDLHSPMIEKCKNETDGRCPTRELMKYLAKEPLLFEPGERWNYSLCHDVLAALVEVISGERFGEYVKKNIFDVVGMNDSTFLLYDSELDKVSTQYVFDSETQKAVECSKTIQYKLGSEYESGGAGCISTVDDYIKFLEGMRAGKLLKHETIDLMTTNCLSEEQKENYWVEKYGYGLGVRCSMGNDGITDFGWGGAAGAYLVIDRENEITVFYAQHVLSHPIDRQKINAVVHDILK